MSFSATELESDGLESGNVFQMEEGRFGDGSDVGLD